jgi:hypothetical protein
MWMFLTVLAADASRLLVVAQILVGKALPPGLGVFANSRFCGMSIEIFMASYQLSDSTIQLFYLVLPILNTAQYPNCNAQANEQNWQICNKRAPSYKFARQNKQGEPNKRGLYVPRLSIDKVHMENSANK